MDLDRLVATVVDSDASDLILKTGSQPAMKQAGKILFLAEGLITPEDATGILERIARFKEARLQRAVDWTSRLVEPALMVAIGLVIGAIVVLMYLPIFDLASSLQ